MLVTPQETFLDLEEAAAALGMHPHTLQERAAARIIPGFKVGKEWRFRVTRIMAFAEEQENKVREEPWSSTSVARRGGTTSRSDQAELESRLGLKIGEKRSASGTKR